MLTPNQLALLRNDLLNLANIEYAEIMDELLDHYASLTEQFMMEGSSFDEAKQKAWIRLGAAQGIAHIQERYKKLLVKQIQDHHWIIIRHYFRWPTLITTLLIGLLTFLFAQAVSPELVWISFLAFVFVPYVLFIPNELKSYWHKLTKKETQLKSLKRYVVYRQARHGNLLYFLTVQLPGLIAFFIKHDSHIAFRPFLFEWHIGLSAALTFVAAIYTLTFVELYGQQQTHFSTSS